MALLKPIRLNFKYEFFQKSAIYPFFIYPKNKTEGPAGVPNTIYIVNDIPPYLHLGVNDIDWEPFKIVKFNQFSGFLANLEGYQEIEGYMDAQFGAKSRSKMRSYLRRLETCFNIQYKIHYGEITTDEFQFLFDRCRLMIQQRFAQRGDTHESLKDWDLIKKTAYSLILEKKASLFVISHDENPIDICFNYHHQNVMNNYIRSYDIAYSKFRLGYIDILKQLEWCFKNDHKIFDLGRGDLDYKRRWCNVVYDFEHHVFYHKNNLRKKIVAHAITKYYLLKEFLKKKGVHLLYHKIKGTYGKEQNSGSRSEDPIFEMADVPKDFVVHDMPKIDITVEEYGFLRKPVYDFQYTNFERTREVSVFKMAGVDNQYIIIGKRKKQKLTFKPQPRQT